MKQLHFVVCSVETRMAVIAESAREAQQVAREHFEEEIQNGLISIEVGNVERANSVYDIPTEWEYSLPYGVPENDNRRNWTCRKWIEDS